jgi:cytochrome c-type biogenesis protein CcmE
MKNLQKFILPALIGIVILIIAARMSIIYIIYLSPSTGLGSFSDFDPNNNAVKDIKVHLVLDRGINKDSHGGARFYASDKGGNVVLINADKIPAEIESVKVLILRGHLSQDNSFHAHDVLLD